MAFRIASQFDQRYGCLTCNRTDLNRRTDLNERTWTCHTCGQPVQIAMTDASGNSFIVERHPAKNLVPGDYLIYQRRATIDLSLVIVSSQSKSKGSTWYLALKGFGKAHVEPDRYINRIR